ncbi:MAG TPA: hypothetical protein VNX40_14240 [Mucilaginibacter sp.]|jgi:hypothetical protein|nr:hypothetical protein [Mucilaginibacter sp.]
MESEFLMRSICYDMVLLDDKSQYTMFVDADDVPGERVSGIVEKQIVEWFFDHPRGLTASLFYEELGIDPARYKPYFEVRKPIINDNGTPGDIDVLLIDPKKPQHTIAIQVKRVKARIDQDEKITLNTAHIENGIFQTKKMFEKYRFHLCFLMVVIVADSRHRRRDQQILRIIPYADKKHTVYFHHGYGDLPTEVGVYFLEISQPSANEIDKTAQVSAKLQIPAKPIEQFARTTEKIKEMLKSR